MPLPALRPVAPPPAPLEPYRRLADADRLLGGGDIDGAIAIYAAHRAGPVGALAELRLGEALRLKGDLDGAREALSAAVAARPRDADALLALGDLERDAGEFGEAEQLYCGAVAVRPDAPEPVGALADLLRARGRLAEARALLATASGRHPNHAALLESRSLVEREAGDAEAADLCLKRAHRASGAAPAMRTRRPAR